MAVVIIADLTAGTGRFNVARGTVGLIFTVAAAASTTIFGFVDQEMSQWSAFLGMAGVAAMGGLVVWVLLDETKPAKYGD